MKIKFKPAPRALFDPFDGLDEETLAAIEAKTKRKKCAPGERHDPKTGKCAVKGTKKAVR